MPAKSKPDTAAADATRAASKSLRLAYKRPWRAFVPIATLFLMLNYAAWCSETDESGKERQLPAYVASYAASRAYAREASPAGVGAQESTLMNTLLFFEERVMGLFFDFGTHWFGSLSGIQMVCTIAWLIHIFELGMCSRMCWSCNASVGTMVLYEVCTALAGFAQLAPLTAARNEWVAQVKAAGEAATSTPSEEAKKEK